MGFGFNMFNSWFDCNVAFLSIPTPEIDGDLLSINTLCLVISFNTVLGYLL